MRPAPRRSRRGPLLVLAGLVVLAAGAAAAVWHWSGATLAGDPVGLARVELDPFAGRLVSARATTSGGAAVPLTVAGGLLTPRTPVTPGEKIDVTVVVKRAGWLAWALGKERREQLTVDAPVASVTDRWLTRPSGSTLLVRFDQPVTSVQVKQPGRPARSIQNGGRTPPAAVHVPAAGAAGTLQVRAAVRSWERLGPAQSVSWFPQATQPVAVVNQAPGTRINPVEPIRLTFAQPVDEVLGSDRPGFSPAVAGRWTEPDDHTLLFTPTGLGAGLDTTIHLRLPKTLAVVAEGGTSVRAASRVTWTVPPGRTLRMEQLLAEAGYLPVRWTPDGSDVPRSARAQLSAAVDPPAGRFDWRYPNTPPELKRLWKEGDWNTILQGAVMMFQDRHHLTVDGLPGPVFWRTLLQTTLAGERKTDGYSYVYVHRDVPQLLTLWHNGKVVLTSPGNTGVPQAPTALGTFPVFEHIPVGTMSGTNPDGSHYYDPGIKWISYFHGGEALHSFTRASYGTPQSLGCVELPMAAAAKVWPYTPIGTLVTIES
jgi:hypothetical protein